jgi:hypothetical protein
MTIDIEKLKALALAATPQDFDSAQINHEGGWTECPTCGGGGYVSLGNDYCNYDSAALGVQFYGIGDEHVKAEAYYRAANPAAVLELIAEVKRLRADAERLDFMITEECQIEHMTRPGAAPLYRVRWPWEEAQMRYWHPTAREAIDAAIEANNGRSPSCGP